MAPLAGRWLLCACLCSARPALGGPEEPGDATCAAAGTCGAQGGSLGAAPAAAAERYHWPNSRGHVGRYGVSPHVGPRNLSGALAWEWHPPKGRYSTIFNGGALIDDQMNVYTATIDGVYKVSPEGKTLWEYTGQFSAVPSLLDGVLYGSQKTGFMFALSMETGLPLWSVKVEDSIGPDITGMGVHAGVVLASSNGNALGGDRHVTAVNATDGRVLWTFKADSQLWNFMPMFTDNESAVFQDQIGGVYHVRLADGGLIWKTGYSGSFEETWTDGLTTLGPNGIVYSVHVSAPIQQLGPQTPGDLSAYRLRDGKLLWRQPVPYAPNSQPLVARLRPGAGLSVVMPIGAQAAMPLWFMTLALLSGGVPFGFCCGLAHGCACRCCCQRCCEHARDRRWVTWRARRGAGLGALLALLLALTMSSLELFHHNRFPAEVRTYDAETGRLQWSWAPPLWEWGATAGDVASLYPRVFSGASQPVCMPNPWGSPSVDAEGTVYLGYMDGRVYALADRNGDNVIDNETEVSSFDIGHSFGHPGASLAPGTLAIASCEGLYVFRR